MRPETSTGTTGEHIHIPVRVRTREREREREGNKVGWFVLEVEILGTEEEGKEEEVVAIGKRERGVGVRWGQCKGGVYGRST